MALTANGKCSSCAIFLAVVSSLEICSFFASRKSEDSKVSDRNRRRTISERDIGKALRDREAAVLKTFKIRPERRAGAGLGTARDVLRTGQKGCLDRPGLPGACN